MTSRTRIHIGYAFVFLLVVAGLVFAGKLLMPGSDVDQQVAVKAHQAPEVKHEETAPVPIKAGKIRAYQPEMKARLKLPESVQADVTQVVVASSRIDADDRPMTVTAVTNTETGETAQFFKYEAQPWLSFNAKSELGVYAGLRGTEQAIRVMARQELLQVKALHVGALANVDIMRGNTETFVGVGVWARW